MKIKIRSKERLKHSLAVKRGKRVCRGCLAKITPKPGNIPICQRCSELGQSLFLVDDCIVELESRIPALFSGPMCPWEGGGLERDFKCDCTYITGCKAIVVKGMKPKIMSGSQGLSIKFASIEEDA